MARYRLKIGGHLADGRRSGTQAVANDLQAADEVVVGEAVGERPEILWIAPAKDQR